MKHQVNCIVNFQTNRGSYIEVKDIIAVEKDYGKIKGSTRENFLITCYFKNKPSYPIGYFRDKASRDIAFNLIKTAGKGSVITLPYDRFFKYIPAKKEQVEKICSVYHMSDLLRQFNMIAYNESSLVNHSLGYEQLQNLRKEKLDKSINKDALIAGLAMTVKLPDNITVQMSATQFWKTKINQLCVI